MPNQKTVSIETLIPDDKNFNTGTEYGGKLIKKSLDKFGAGRSIVIDRNGRVIAGNKTLENAKQAGITEIIIVESTGDRLVAVKRIDVGLETKLGRELALADNATSQANILFDIGAIIETAREVGIDTSDWGLHLDFSKYAPDLEPKSSSGTSTMPEAEPITQVECMCPECLHEFAI